VAKKNFRETYYYECTITGEKFKVSRQAPNPDDLISVKAFYDMHPEKDDRPEDIKKKVAAESQE
jgi:hypothetical protein